MTEGPGTRPIQRAQEALQLAATILLILAAMALLIRLTPGG